MGLLLGLKRQLTSLNIRYLGGHPDLPFAKLVGISSDENSLIFYGGPVYNVVLEIPKTDIVGLELDRASKRSAGKAAAGAIIGGVLTGGVGAIAGAAIGGRKRDDSVIVLTVKYSNTEIEMYFGGEKDNVKQKYPLFARLLKK